MSAKGTMIAKGAVKAVVGGLQLMAFIWATGFWFGMGQRHGEKEADLIDDMVDRAITKHIMKKDLKEFVRENQLKKGERKEMFNRLFAMRNRARNEGWSDEEYIEEVEDILMDYKKAPPQPTEVKKEDTEE